MPSPVKKRNPLSTPREGASALAMTPRLDHRNAREKAEGGRFHAWVNDGTAQPIEPTSYPSHIWINMHSATTPICKAPIRWFSSALSVAENTASAIVFFPPRPPLRSVARSAAPHKSRMAAVLGDRRGDDHII